jgi:hypothetical protein
MKVMIALFIMSVGLVCTLSAGLVEDSSIGHMPEVVIMAPRYEHEDVAWSGLVETVVVTAPRYEFEDIAWSGLMETVVVTASPYDDAGASASTTGYGSARSRFYPDIGSREMLSNIGLFSYTIIIMLAGLFIALYVVLHSGHKERRLAPCTSECEHTR